MMIVPQTVIAFLTASEQVYHCTGFAQLLFLYFSNIAFLSPFIEIRIVGPKTNPWLIATVPIQKRNVQPQGNIHRIHQSETPNLMFPMEVTPPPPDLVHIPAHASQEVQNKSAQKLLRNGKMPNDFPRRSQRDNTRDVGLASPRPTKASKRSSR